MINATVPFTSLQITKGLDSGSCTCTVDTFMNIICFLSPDFFWPCYVDKEIMANPEGLVLRSSYSHLASDAI